MSARDVAIATIEAEHHALSAVLHALQELLAKVVTSYGAPEFGLFCAALYYIDDFQERCHHPKEDQYFFKSLRAATSEFDTRINELQAEHVSGALAVSQLHRHLVHYQGGVPKGLEIFRAAVDAYVTQMVDHMHSEEYLLERGREVISEADWVRIAAAFNENDDPLFSDNRREEFGRLYHRILLLAPRKLKPALHSADEALSRSE
jgi:hemerythrin-like domain-containing protein